MLIGMASSPKLEDFDFEGFVSRIRLCDMQLYVNAVADLVLNYSNGITNEGQVISRVFWLMVGDVSREIGGDEIEPSSIVDILKNIPSISDDISEIYGKISFLVKCNATISKALNNIRYDKAWLDE